MATVTPNVLVASDDPVLMDELIRYLEEIPHWRLIGSAATAEELRARVELDQPDAAIVSDGLLTALLSSPSGLGRTRLLVVGREESAATLRKAMRAAARGFVLWPSERKELISLVESGLSKRSRRSQTLGSLNLMWSAKGGSGSSVLAAHLAARLAQHGTPSLLVDLDLDNADLSAILGAEDESKNVLDLLRIVDEITPDSVKSVSWQHRLGFDTILAPGRHGESAIVKGTDISKVLVAARGASEAVIVDMPSGYSELGLTVAEEATSLFIVVTPDVLSLRRGRDLAATLRSSGNDPERVKLVLNQSVRGEISPADAEAVVGRPVAAVIRADSALYRAADRGQLSERGARMMDPLARVIAGTEPAPAKRLRTNKR